MSAPLPGAEHLDGEEAVLADKDVVDDYTLRRRRLTGSMARGRLWRTRPERGTLGYLAIGTALALVVLLIVGMVAFVRTQLAMRPQPAPMPPPTAIGRMHDGTPTCAAMPPGGTSPVAMRQENRAYTWA